MNSISIKEGNIDDVVKVNNTIDEYQIKFSKQRFLEKLADKKYSLITIAYAQNTPIGFLISYQATDNTLEIWCTGVTKKFRSLGVFTKLQQYTEETAIKHNYHKIITDTSNRYLKSLHYYLNHGFQRYNFDKFPNILNNKIYLEKTI